MKYLRGEQDYKLEEMPMIKINLTDGPDDCSEGIWARQADDHVALQNNSISFYPFPSWGLIVPSTPDDSSDYREVVNISYMKKGKMELTIHPEAWDAMLKSKKITEEGEFIG